VGEKRLWSQIVSFSNEGREGGREGETYLRAFFNDSDVVHLVRNDN